MQVTTIAHPAARHGARQPLLQGESFLGARRKVARKEALRMAQLFRSGGPPINGRARLHGVQVLLVAWRWDADELRGTALLPAAPWVKSSGVKGWL